MSYPITVSLPSSVVQPRKMMIQIQMGPNIPTRVPPSKYVTCIENGHAAHPPKSHFHIFRSQIHIRWDASIWPLSMILIGLESNFKGFFIPYTHTPCPFLSFNSILLTYVPCVGGYKVEITIYLQPVTPFLFRKLFAVSTISVFFTNMESFFGTVTNQFL